MRINDINTGSLSADLSAAGHEGRLWHADVSVREDGQRHQGVHQHAAGGVQTLPLPPFSFTTLPLHHVVFLFPARSRAVPPWTRPEAGGPQDHPVRLSGAEGPEQRLVLPVAGDLPATANQTVKEFRMLRPKYIFLSGKSLLVSPAPLTAVQR